MRDTGPMRAAVFGSWSHQASLVKLGAEAEGPHPCWRRAAAERAAADCVAAEPSAARAHAALRCTRPLRGAQLPAACSRACASLEYRLRRSGCEIAWRQARGRQGGGRVEGGPARNGRTQRSSPLGHLCCVCCGLLLCARACACVQLTWGHGLTKRR